MCRLKGPGSASYSPAAVHASAGGCGPIQSVEGAVGQQHRDTMTSSVTAAWGAKWNEKMIARDIMQNFFDASRGRPLDVEAGSNQPDGRREYTYSSRGRECVDIPRAPPRM